jgi:hypothetical protein
MSPQVRQIDRITVKGSIQPMGLFTYDVQLDQVGQRSWQGAPLASSCWL